MVLVFDTVTTSLTDRENLSISGVSDTMCRKQPEIDKLLSSVENALRTSALFYESFSMKDTLFCGTSVFKGCVIPWTLENGEVTTNYQCLNEIDCYCEPPSHFQH